MSEQQSIAEFLTQRFAELEAKAKEAPPTSWRLVEVKGTRGALFSAIDVRAYVLADIAAKRRILAAWPDPFGNWSAEEAAAARAVKDRVLRLLATPFASHEAYDPSWALDTGGDT